MSIIFNGKSYGKYPYKQHCIPIKNNKPLHNYAYVLDGKKHGKIPPIVAPELAYIWGLENVIKAGYKPYYIVFEDVESGIFTYENYTSFIHSPDIESRKLATTFKHIDITLLQ